MMKRVLVAAVMAVSCSVGVAAETQAPGLEKVAAASSDPFEQMLSARHVAEFARRRHDPMAMLVAAKMLREVPFRDQTPPPARVEGVSPPPAEFTPEGLFREARTLANGDPQLLSQIRIAEASGSRGVMSSIFGAGLVRVVQDLNGRAVYGFPIEAKGGEVLRIGAIGDVTTHMSMRLRDAHGKVVCDDGGDYAPVCSVKPAVATALRVEIVNQGANPTRAVILSN